MENFFCYFFCEILSNRLTHAMISKLRDVPAVGFVCVKRTGFFCEADPDNFKLKKMGKNIKYMSRMQEIALEIDHLKQQLREREREREQL